MWSKATVLQSCPERSATVAKLRNAAISVVAWTEDMKAYEESSKDFMASVNALLPTRCLQANIVYQGRVRYLHLLTELTQELVEMRKNMLMH